MKYERQEWMEDEYLQKMLNNRKDDRVHPTLTDLIYCLTKTSYKEKMPDFKPSRTQALYFVLGLGLEKTLLVKNPEDILVGEKDGIPYHLDSLDVNELVEMKTTRKRLKDHPDISEGWEKQIKGYLYAEGLTEVNLVTLHIIEPEIRIWRLSFTQEELEENWHWLTYRKAVYDEFRENGEVPTPFEFNMDWECKGCEFKSFCDAHEAAKRIISLGS